MRERGKPLNVLAAVWLSRPSGFVQYRTHILWLRRERGFPLTRYPRWLAVSLIRLARKVNRRDYSGKGMH